MKQSQQGDEKTKREKGKAERLAEQLRANLRRRKAQAKDMDNNDPSAKG